MLENQEIESLMKDVVRYERTIGDLIERNEHLSSEVSRLNAIQLVAIDNKQNSIGSDLTSLATILFRMNEQQGRQFDNIYNLLAEIIANPVLSKSTIRDLVEAKHHSSLFSETITRIVTGQAVETLSKINVQITETTKVRALRGKLIFDQTSDDKSRAQAVLQENTDNGVHSLIFPVLETSATGFRGLRLEIKPQTTRSVRIRIRQIDAPENISEVNIDLHSLKYAHFNSVYDLGKRDIVIRSLAGGWIQVLLEASLSLGAGPVEIELIALNSVNAKSSQRIGTGRNAFGVRSLQVLMSSGLNQRQNITGAANDYIESSQQVDSKIVHEISMPAVEKVRSAKRHEYLQSGAYKSLTKFRNCHAGKRAFIIGNGPSINGQDLTLLKDEITFATNWFINHPNFSAINPDYYCVSSHEMFGGWG
ncbi:hypothetical protein P6U16_22625 (plasmid) [Rhizobium sp. 32-5/1]|uniref:hypothetical protein n=1 Tax=Rhizobium sp. 32-5/1 TaxID=3019602 RepID=UPI00240D88A4|nr:hypothetical protein [Rhizobium sp. 32-5/1]WEZ85815.1 hypothetical protein P6U16_22625 [Rhizobium sp. 32-5/1]